MQDYNTTDDPKGIDQSKESVANTNLLLAGRRHTDANVQGPVGGDGITLEDEEGMAAVHGVKSTPGVPTSPVAARHETYPYAPASRPFQ